MLTSECSYDLILTLDVRQLDYGSIPLHLRDAHYAGAQKLDSGKGYLYPHNYEKGFVKQQYLPDKLRDRDYYQPKDHGFEASFAERLKQLKQKK